MKFSTAAVVEQVVWEAKLCDLPRAENRALINNLANGMPPYTEDEARDNGVQVNVNFLPLAKITHDARRQLFNAFLNTGNYFAITECDYGPKHKRKEWAHRLTRGITKAMKRSTKYFEGTRSVHAGLVLHGIGPKVWFDRERWCATAVGIEDVLIPSNTLLTMENLPFFAVFQQYTAAELYMLTHGPRPDPGWNMKLVDAALKWADQQTRQETTYAESYSPEKIAERFKQDLGMYGSDSVPTIDTWHFYFWNDDDRHAGWQKRIVLDSPAPNEASTNSTKRRVSADAKTIIGTRGDFLFNPGRRKYADHLSEIIHWQFADTSAVGPFRYHSVRSLGWLLYAVCHLQNRIQCQFSESVFESLMQFYRVANPEDAERLVALNLLNRRAIPESLQFVKAEERWQVNEGMVGNAIQMYRQIMADNSASFTQSPDIAEKKEAETATAVMARVNAASSLVNSMLSQAYRYAEFEDREIARRFCIKNSKDPDVRRFRVEMLKAGIPEEALDPDCWDIEHERVLGGGNKVLQFAQVDKMMSAYPLYDAEPQREVLNQAVRVWTDDPDLANRLVPIEKKSITDSVHDAQGYFGTLMQGVPVGIKTGVNHPDAIEALLAGMAVVVQRIESTGGMATKEEIIGLQTVGQHVQQHIDKLSEDKSSGQKVKQYSDHLGQMMNMVKAYTQRLQQAMQKQAQAGSGGPDPKDAAKLQAQMAQDKLRIENTRKSRAEKAAQRQLEWEQQMRQRSVEHQQKMQHDREQKAADVQARLAEAKIKAAETGIKTAAQIRATGLKATQPKPNQE